MKNFLLCFFAFLVLGCAQETGYNSVTPTIVAKGNLTGNGKEQFSKQSVVISDSVTWKKLIVGMNSVSDVSGSFLETHIDFTQYTVLAVFDDVRPTLGYSIDINIVEDDKKVYVEVINKMPSGNVLTALITTQPYLIVKIPKTEKTIQFNS